MSVPVNLPTKSSTGLPVVLAIDDVNINLLMIKETLSSIVTLYTVKSASDAIKLLRLVAVDLLLLDLGMPGMDGFTFLEQIRSMPEYGGLPVIIVSSDSKHETLEKTLNYGVTDYIVKPFQMDLLREKVARALNLHKD